MNIDTQCIDLRFSISNEFSQNHHQIVQCFLNFNTLFLALNRKHGEDPGKELRRNFGSKNVIALKLDIEAGLTLSLLGGLAEIKEHAKYLNDTAASSNVAKVSLTYKETTVYRALTSDGFYNLDYRNPLIINEAKDKFTHAVVGIQYGITCSMVFEREIKDSETKEEIEVPNIEAEK